MSPVTTFEDLQQPLQLSSSPTMSKSMPILNSSSPNQDNIIDTPRLENGKVTKRFVDSLIKFYRRSGTPSLNNNNNPGLLPSATLHKILRDARDLFASQATLVEIDLGRDDVLNICGDVHGQFFDLCRIFDLFGAPSTSNRYLFNGDFVDRGVWSTEVVVLLFSLALLHPDCVHLARGNHEAEEVNRFYGFLNEMVDKYDRKTFSMVQDAFCWLPLTHRVNGSVLVMHGGLPAKDGVTLEDIRALKRGGQVDKDGGVMTDLLWADPQDAPGLAPNPRGFSVLFGPDVTARFLELNDLLYIVRSHECVQYGYELCHDDKVVTVFSAPNYCDRHSNKGAVCVLHGDDVSMPEFKKFEAAPHPKVEDNMMYASLFVKMGIL